MLTQFGEGSIESNKCESLVLDQTTNLFSLLYRRIHQHKHSFEEYKVSQPYFPEIQNLSRRDLVDSKLTARIYSFKFIKILKKYLQINF